MTERISMPKIDLNPHEWEEVSRILLAHVPEFDVWAFGSRVKWTAKPYSDLDLAIITEHPLPFSTTASLADAFDNSTLTIKVDVVDWASTSESFRKIIESNKLLVQTGQKALADWKFVRLIDCTSDGNLSYGIVQPGQHVANGVPIIRVNNFDDMRLNLQSVLRVSSEIEEKHKRTRLQGGEVLLTLVGSVGQSVVVPSELAGWNVARAIAVIRPHPDIGANWLNICLQTKAVKQFLDERANTTVQKTLNLGDVKEVLIPIPPKETKNEIEATYMALTNKITLLRETNATLETIAQALFKSWFVNFDPVRAKAEGREPEGIPPEIAALFPSEFDDSELGEIPKGWKVGSLSDHAEFLNGYAFKAKDWSEAGHPVVKIGNVKPGIIDVSSCSFVNPDTVSALNRFKLVRGDLVVGMTGYVGETGLVPEQVDMPYLNQRVGRISTKLGLHDLGYVYCLTRNPKFKAFAENRAHGSAQANVSGSALMSYPALIMPNAILDCFNSIAYSILDSTLARHEELLNLTTLRDTLLPRLMSGKLRIPDVEGAAL